MYKLQELQEKFRLFQRGNRVLDLGSSPGSWSLYILDILGEGGKVTGVDLNPPDQALSTRRGFRFIHGDFFLPEILARVTEEGPFDVVVSDAAPSTSGNRTSDTARSLELARQVLRICRQVLSPGGNMAVKIFQGGEEREVLDDMRKSFRTARAFKPKASRRDSMEIYFAGCGFISAHPPGGAP